MKTKIKLWFLKLHYKYLQHRARELSDTGDHYFLEAQDTCDKIEEVRARIFELGGNL